jgi:hypothetical protein
MPPSSLSKAPRTLPPDNPPMLLHIIEEELPQLSLRDIDALGKALNERYLALKRRQQLLSLEEQHGPIRALPPGTPLQLRHDVRFTKDTLLTKGATLTIHRQLRKPSPRIIMQDADGNRYSMPMSDLKRLSAEESQEGGPL